ncbi:MAG TPA: flagellar motor protein MotB, partial [Treponemataceae bacterium]|nr:flagellar motor protein MotB [Treponemataceae bacterium]
MKFMTKKIVGLMLVMLIIISAGFAQKERVYISPNNDGVQDELIIPIKITDVRYIKEWSFIIEDDKGNIVRTIGNKEKRPEKLTFKSFWTQLISPKKGVVVPESVMWNGFLDSGELAQDGLYYYYLTASDDNDNVSKTTPLEVFVDNTPPEITLVQPKESDKIFGAGNKPTISISQKGSKEDLWTASLVDVSGYKVKTWTWENTSPTNIDWDGKNDLEVAVPEGVYSYSIGAIDKAGNKSKDARIDNIIYDAIPRSLNLLVNGSPFSPKTGEGRQLLSIVPSMSSSSGLLEWNIVVKNADNKVVKKWTGANEAPEPFDYDGLSSSSKVLEDGDYQIDFNASYNNGQSASILRKFTVDTTKPRASVRTSSEIFSPDGDGNLDTLTIFQTASKEKAWTGII